MAIIEADANRFGGYPRVKYGRVLIPHAAVLTLNASPFLLVPDAPSGFAHMLHMISIHKPAGTTVYASGTGELEVRYRGQNNTTQTQFDASNFNNTGNRDQFASAFSASSGNSSQTLFSARGLELRKNTGEFSGGDADQPFYVHVFYQTIQLAF